MSTDAKIGQVNEESIANPKQVVTFWHIYFLGIFIHIFSLYNFLNYCLLLLIGMAMKLGGFAMGWNYGKSSTVNTVLYSLITQLYFF